MIKMFACIFSIIVITITIIAYTSCTIDGKIIHDAYGISMNNDGAGYEVIE